MYRLAGFFPPLMTIPEKIPIGIALISILLLSRTYAAPCRCTGSDIRSRLAPTFIVMMSGDKKQTNGTERCLSSNSNRATQLIMKTAADNNGVAHIDRKASKSPDKVTVMSSALSVNNAVNLGRHVIVVLKHDSL